MSLKYSNTTADYLQWGEAMNLVRSLYKDEDYDSREENRKAAYYQN